MTREEWLNNVVANLESLLGITLNFKHKISCGFTKRKKNIVEAHPPHESSAGYWEIFVNPTTGKEDAYEIVNSLIFLLLQIHTGKSGRGCYRSINNYVYRCAANSNRDDLGNINDLTTAITDAVGEYPHDKMFEQESVTKEKQMYTVNCALCGTSFYMNKGKIKLAPLFTCACGSNDLKVK